MTFFKKLKALFNKEKVILTEEIYVEDLGYWFSDKIKEKFDLLKEDIEDYFAKISGEKDLTKENLQKLEKAGLMNDKIPSKVRQILEGNREAHIIKNNQFLKNLVLPENTTYNSTLEFCALFEKELGVLAHNTVKSYHVLQEFFANESSVVAENIKNIDSYMKNIKEILKDNKTGRDEVEISKKLIEKLINRISLKEKTLQELQIEKTELDALFVMKRANLAKLEKLKFSPEFAKLNGFIKKKETIRASIKAQESDLNILLLPVKKLLKKFLHYSIDYVQIVGLYLDNSMQALLNDKDFKILTALAKLRDLVLNDALGVKDKQKEKTLSAISEITSQKLNFFIKNIQELKDELFETERKARLINLGNNIDDINYKLNHLNDKISNYEKKVEKLNQALEKTDITATKLDLQSRLGILFDVNLIIYEGEKNSK